MKQLQIFFSIIIYILLAIWSYYLSGALGVLWLVQALIIYFLLFYFLHFLFRKIRKKEIQSVGVYARKFFFSTAVFLSITIVLLWSYSYYFNEKNPATMPEYTLSNGEKTVKFQAMMHIGSEKFYETVIQNLTNFKQEGAVYFFEWVKPGTQENHEKLSTALGIDFDEDLYQNVAKLYGLTEQDTSKFLWKVNSKDYNIDIWIDEIIEIYEKKPVQKKEKDEVINVNEEVIEQLKNLNSRELALFAYINQAVLNHIIGSESMRKQLEWFQNKEIFDVILEDRNKVLAKNVIESKEGKIFITYGLLHFEWFFKLLKESDPHWKIIETKELYPISQK